ncbi:MAG: VOC family protein [Chloroflexi bacterium]|nr:VOC family protein [Chloroflexota bacterium]
MPVTGFDHVSYPTKDSERFLEFYKRLGFKINNEEKWRKGESKIFSVQVAPNAMINVHPGFQPEERMRGRTATPGCADFCMVWEGTVDEVMTLLKKAGIRPTEGPVPRRGGRGAGTIPSTSVYITDPDGNLVEFMVYDKR